jgi:cell wall-associated NlpC family hydrolase
VAYPLVRSARARLRLLLVSLLAASLSTLVAVGPATNAYAAPSCNQVTAQLDSMWNQLEPLIEQYNGVHEQLRRNRAKQAKLSRQIQPLQLQVDVAMTKVSSISEFLYKSGPASMLNAVLTSGSPTTLADQLATMDQLARGQQETIKGVTTMVGKYNVQKRPLDALVTKLAAQDHDLAARKRTIESKQAAMQKLRQSACGVDTSGRSLKIGACPAQYFGDAGSKAAQFACNQIGKPYVWATAGPNTYDCSGLTQAAWSTQGVSLAHYTVTQYNETSRVSRSNLRPGDLVFFFSDMHHMAIYVGNGMVVHAPQTGDVVRMMRMDTLPIYGYGRPG